jgi:hypothetical protein
MRREIRDPEVALLASLSGTIRADYAAEDLEWEGSPFAWIRTRRSRQVGAIGEKLVAGWCAAKGLDVTRSPDSDADRVVQGKRVEIKFSTKWKSGGYKFQQLRDQDYEYAICLGVSPFDAHCWVLAKSLVLKMWGQPEGPQSQHGGAAGRDTAWLTVDPLNIPEWLTGCGGSLSDAFRILSRW